MMTREHGFFVAKALFWALAAAFFVGGIFLESGLDRIIIGFLAGCAFAGVLGFFNREGRGRFY